MLLAKHISCLRGFVQDGGLEGIIIRGKRRVDQTVPTQNYAHARTCVCVFVCVRERERECVCVCERERDRADPEPSTRKDVAREEHLPKQLRQLEVARVRHHPAHFT